MAGLLAFFREQFNVSAGGNSRDYLYGDSIFRFKLIVC
jgi:hypothetical protein